MCTRARHRVKRLVWPQQVTEKSSLIDDIGFEAQVAMCVPREFFAGSMGAMVDVDRGHTHVKYTRAQVFIFN